jgi:hypothetical protein
LLFFWFAFAFCARDSTPRVFVVVVVTPTNKEQKKSAKANHPKRQKKKEPDHSNVAPTKQNPRKTSSPYKQQEKNWSVNRQWPPRSLQQTKQTLNKQ